VIKPVSAVPDPADHVTAEVDRAVAQGLVFLHLPGHLIRRLNQSALSLFVEHCQPKGFDLTAVQWAAVCGIRAYPHLDQASLAGLIAYDKATISGVVDRLVAKNYVSRLVSPRDKRMHQLMLTEDGEALYRAMRPVVEALQEDIMSPLDAEERAVFEKLLLKLVTAHNTRSRVPQRPVPAIARGPVDLASRRTRTARR